MRRAAAIRVQHLIVIRADRKRIFAHDDARITYIGHLQELTNASNCQMLAWCLMSNHIHVLAAGGAAALGHFAQEFPALSERHRAERTLAPRRKLKVVSIPSANWFICARYVECNPVRARMVVRPEDYSWSSYRAHIGLERSELLSLSPWLERFGNTVGEQRVGYRRFVEQRVQGRP